MSKTIRRAFTLAIATCFGTAVVLPTPQAEARGGGTAAAIIGGAIVGAAIMHGLSRGGRHYSRSPRYRTREVRPTRRQPVKEARITIAAIQRALNAFGFNAGPESGKMGPQTRAAIVKFQQKIEHSATGELTEEEQSVLLAAYEKGQQTKSEPARASRIDQLFAALGASPGAGNKEDKPSKNPGVTPVVEVEGFRLLCRDDKMTTALRDTARSDFGTQKLVPDQFCLARSYVLDEASTIFKGLTQKINGLKPDMVRTECARFAEAKQADIAALATEQPDALAKRLAQDGANAKEKERDAAIANSKVCLGFGYAEEKPDVSLAAALFLIGTGQTGYAELIAAHLVLGIGVAKDNARAIAWLEFAANEIDNGAAPIVKSEGIPRAKMLRLVAQELKTGSFVTATPTPPTSTGPSFGPKLIPTQPEAPKREPANFTMPTVKAPDEPQKEGARPDVIAQLRDNTVLIYTVFEKGSDLMEGTGTGFFISPTLLVTNAHVVENVEKLVIVSKAIGVQLAVVRYRGMTSSGGIDAAVVEVLNYKHPTFLQFAADVKEGNAITIAGYPGAAMDSDRGYKQFLELIQRNQRPTTDQIPSTKFAFGLVQSVFIDNDTGLENLQEGVQAASGNSGSPVVNACGQVVAIHYQGTKAVVRLEGKTPYVDASRFNFAISFRALAKFLQGAGVPFQAAAECPRN